MAFPTYIGKGSLQATNSDNSSAPQLPGSIASGDLLIAVVSSPNVPITSTNGDWTLLDSAGTGTSGMSGAVGVYVFYAIYAGVSLGGFTSGGAEPLKIFQTYAFRNAAAPTVTANGVQASAATAWTLPGITTTAADSYVFFAIGNDRDFAGTANVGGYTNANLADITELHDQTTLSGPGGGIATALAKKSTVGDTGTTSCTSAASNTAAFVTFAISTPTVAQLVASPGSYAYTGAQASVRAGRRLTADAGAYAYTGSDAGLLAALRLPADPGAYSYTGTAARTLFNRLLSADAGTYIYAGTAATLSYQTVTGYTLIADPGTYSYTGGNASILVYRKITAEAGVYAYVGSDVTLTYEPLVEYELVADSGSYILTGSDANLVYSGDVPVAPTVVISGKQAQAEWEAQYKWRRQAEKALEAMLEHALEVVQEPAPEAIEISEILPRLYEPVESLAELIADAKLLQLDEAQALESAMMVRDAIKLAELAYLAEVAVQQEKDAIATFLMFME